jgi:hypothetical protein
MTRKHQDAAWMKMRARHKPMLIAALPAPCPRCGGIMERGMPLDYGHISRNPALHLEPANHRLEHRRCNRRDGQRIATAGRLSKANRERMPKW